MAQNDPLDLFVNDRAQAQAQATGADASFPACAEAHVPLPTV